MAPFSKGRVQASEGVVSRAKGGGNKKSFRDDRKRTGSGTRGRNKPYFNTTRIKEQVDDNLSQSEGTPLRNEAIEDYYDQTSSDEEPREVSDSPIKPYNSLLKSLSARNQYEQHQRKKQKLYDKEPSKYSDLIEENADLGLESDDSESSITDNVNDHEVSNMAEDDLDPFMTHFDMPDEAKLTRGIEDVKINRWDVVKTSIDPSWSSSLNIPNSLNTIPSIKAKFVASTESLFLKKRVRAPAARLLTNFDPLTGHLAVSIFDYQDLLFSYRRRENADILREMMCLHVLNHIFKTRDRVIKNNARLVGESGMETAEVRDQGFTRPKILIILPTRQSCVRYVDTIVSLVEPEQQENKKKFHDSYMQGSDEFSSDKPEDFKEVFGGNDDDMFRLGIKFTRKTIKYFSQFYSSDIILASPLGLRMALGEADSKKQDHDFLSSIEVVVVEQAEALAMQNWDHMEYIFERLNLQPKEAHGCDFGRVRNWYLDNQARYLRQTVLLSAFNFPLLNKIFFHHMHNISGKAKYHQDYNGAMLDLGIQLKQTFSRYDTSSPVTDPDDRFRLFTASVLPPLTKYSQEIGGAQKGVLLYIPIYADFVRVRNFLSSSPSAQNISFGSISEYTSVRDVARARSHFLSGRHSLLLYTERAHHFRRYQLKGVKTIIMYGLPENPRFYKEMVGGYLGSSIAEGMLDPGVALVRSLFSRFDALKLERIVGTKRYTSLLHKQDGDTFDFL